MTKAIYMHSFVLSEKDEKDLRDLMQKKNLKIIEIIKAGIKQCKKGGEDG